MVKDDDRIVEGEEAEGNIVFTAQGWGSSR